MSAIADKQLALLNASWRASLARSPWAQALRERYDLPMRFESWNQFGDEVPQLGRSELTGLVSSVSASRRGFRWLSTGGSTSEPFRFPVFRRDDGSGRRLAREARSGLGVAPRDRLFLLWGHAHLFGEGLSAMVARWRRAIADRALGYCRFSAYRLSPEDLRRAGDALLRHRSRYVIGYSSALDRFARANKDRSEAFADLRLKVVIATAEGFPADDSRSVIQSCLGAPVVMEYGAMESGIIAYERRDRPGFDVFWRRHRLEVKSDVGQQLERELVITSLYPRALPLLRYRIGDLIEPEYDGEDLVSLASVAGRCNDVVRLSDGTPIHSELITHVMRSQPGVTGFQILNRSGADPEIRYEGLAFAEAVETHVRRRLATVHPSLAKVALSHVRLLKRSRAGKLPLVVEARPQ
ncbi:MAG: hypothetical protein AAGA95_04580 [Pseudomonadota bacterium]